MNNLIFTQGAFAGCVFGGDNFISSNWRFCILMNNSDGLVDMVKEIARGRVISPQAKLHVASGSTSPGTTYQKYFSVFLTTRHYNTKH
jgi:hypothetical protein